MSAKWIKKHEQAQNVKLNSFPPVYAVYCGVHSVHRCCIILFVVYIFQFHNWANEL